jgi:chromosome segregation ATPase
VPIIHVQNYFNEPLGNDAVFDVQPLEPQQDQNRLEEARAQIESHQQNDELSILHDRLMAFELRDQEMQNNQTRIDSLLKIIATMNVDFDPSNQVFDPETSLQSYRDELLALRKVSRVSDHQRLEIESLREELAKYINTITTLRREQSSGEERISGFQSQLENYVSDLESLRQQLLEKTETCLALEEEVSSSKAILEAKTSECEVLLMETNLLREQLEEVSGEHGQHSSEFEALQKSYNEKSEELDRLLSKCATDQVNYSNKLQEFEELQQRANSLQIALDEKTLENQNLLSKMSELCQKQVKTFDSSKRNFQLISGK